MHATYYCFGSLQSNALQTHKKKAATLANQVRGNLPQSTDEYKLVPLASWIGPGTVRIIFY